MTNSGAGVDDAQIVREMIRHENELLNQRMTWFCTIQGLLWAALAFSWNDAPYLAYVLSALGVLVAASSFFAFRASILAIIRIREWWDSQKPAAFRGPDVIGRTPDHRSIPWLRPQLAFPIGFAVAWIAIAAIQAVGVGSGLLPEN